jgi:hypothetical protein
MKNEAVIKSEKINRLALQVITSLGEKEHKTEEDFNLLQVMADVLFVIWDLRDAKIINMTP